MIDVQEHVADILKSMQVKGLHIPAATVTVLRSDEPVPDAMREHFDDSESVTACEALRSAMAGTPVLLTMENIGCVAAAVTFGFVPGESDDPLPGRRVYTEIMRQSSGQGEKFVPPPPHEFTNGTVYACGAVGRTDRTLFGAKDSGRFKDSDTARSAVEQMVALPPGSARGVFFAPPEFSGLTRDPDVVVLAVRPVELLRILQAHQFLTGERTEANIGALRAVDSDLVVRPMLTGRMNISAYCLGARLIAGFEAERMGLGVPTALLPIIAEGMSRSATGYPFHLYPGADPSVENSGADADTKS